MVTPRDSKARAALGWGVRELAKNAGLSANTVSRFENGAGALADTLQLMQEALERAGILFIPEDERAGPGVRIMETSKGRGRLQAGISRKQNKRRR